MTRNNMFLGASGMLENIQPPTSPPSPWHLAVGDRISQVDRAKSVVWSMLAKAMQSKKNKSNTNTTATTTAAAAATTTTTTTWSPHMNIHMNNKIHAIELLISIWFHSHKNLSSSPVQVKWAIDLWRGPRWGERFLVAWRCANSQFSFSVIPTPYGKWLITMVILHCLM